MDKKQNILVCDDDADIVRAIAIYLTGEGYSVYSAYDGFEALDIISTKKVHLIILDIMMPKMDGLSAVMKIREKENIPIILLSAKSENTDKVLGLSVGADDYITKPFDPGELIARVKSQLRRYTALGGEENRSGGDVIVNGFLQLDDSEKVLTRDGEPVRLTATEYKIISFLMNNPGIVFSAEQIYEKVWQEPSYSCENTVMVHIRRIREKIEINPKKPEYLKVMWGVGYKLEKH